ncbi:calcium-dependent protein kinase [Trebouxia sp. C0010 RCD-2024]
MTEFAATLSSVVTAGHGLHQRIAAQCTHSLVSALQHCHQLGVAHCCLTLDTSYVIKDAGAFTVKPGGFEDSQLYRDRGRLSRMLKLTAYTAPEVAAGQYTWTADLWSLGSVVHCLLAGRPPMPVVAGAGGLPAAALPCRAVDFMVIDPAICHVTERLLRPKQSQRLPIKHVINNPWVQQGIKLGEWAHPAWKAAANNKGAEKTGVAEDKPLETCRQCPVKPTEALPAANAIRAKAVKAQLQMQPTATAGLDAAHRIPPSEGDQGVPAEVKVTPESPCGQCLHAMGPASVKMVVYRHWPLHGGWLRATIRAYIARTGEHRAKQTRVGKRGTAGTAAGVPARRAQKASVQPALNKYKRKQAAGKGNKKPLKSAASAGGQGWWQTPQGRPQHQTPAAFCSASESPAPRQDHWEALLDATAAAGQPMAIPAAKQAAQRRC